MILLDLLAVPGQAPAPPPVASGSSGPWWGTAAVAGGFTVLGVVLTLFGTQLTEWIKARRERATTERRQEREQAAHYDATVQATVNEIIRERHEAKRLVPHSVDDVTAARSALAFYLSPTLLSAAEKMAEAFTGVVIDWNPAQEGTHHRLATYHASRLKYVNAVRAEFGLKALPQRSPERETSWS